MANKNIKINLDYSDFSGGITDCQRKMKLLNEEFKLQQSALGNNAAEVDKLTLSQSTLSAKIDLQEKIVQKASEKFDALANSESASTAQVDRAHEAYIKQLTKLSDLTNELENVNEKLDEATQAESDMANSTDGNTNSTTNLDTSIITTISNISSFISACQQAAQQLSELATESTKWADNLETLSSQMGVSTTTLQQLAYAADFVDVSVETMQGSMSKLTKKMGEAQSGSTSAQQAFKTLGVSITNTDGSLKSTEQVFYEVIDALGDIENQAERDAVSMDVFGKSAQDLNSLIDAGSGALQAYGQEAQDLGIIMSEGDVKALSKMQDSFDRLNSVMDAAGRSVSAALAPALSLIADRISEMDPGVLAAVKGFSKLLGVVGSLAPTLQALSAIAQLATMSKTAMAGASTVAAGAEVTLAGAATATDMALAPQIGIIILVVAAIGTLALVIKEIIDLYNQYKEAADKASDSTSKFANASKGVASSDSAFGAGESKHYALGGRAGGRVWVGEQGAELVDLPYGSTVYNHQESSNMSSSSNVFNVTIDAKSVDEFNKVVNVFSGLSQSMNRGNKVYG